MSGEHSVRGKYLGLLQDALLDRTNGRDPMAELASAGLIWPRHAPSMVTPGHMAFLRQVCEAMLVEEIPGDFVECGVWRGGACIMMRAVLASYEEQHRQVWVCDSFEGLPTPDARYQRDTRLGLHLQPELRISEDNVRANFERYGLLDERVHFVRGWFEDTLPALVASGQVPAISVLRMDGDHYGSTLHILEALYPLVSIGGWIIEDDYLNPGLADHAKAAVDDYRAAHGITEEIIPVTWGGAWRKERSV